MSSANQMFTNLLTKSCIGKFINITESNNILRIDFTQIMAELISNGLKLSFKSIVQNLIEEYKVAIQVEDYNGLNIRIFFESCTKPEIINLCAITIIQYIQESVYAYTTSLQPTQQRYQYKNVLLTGSAGWLGQFVCHDLICRHLSDVFGLVLFGAYNEQIPHWLIPSRRFHFDITSEKSIETVLSTIKPDIIIHLAAISSPVKCHQNPTLAYQINSPELLIQMVNKYCPQSLFIFSSTDMVYDGETPSYKADPCFSNNTLEQQQFRPKPVNIYGDSKLKFEELVTTKLENSVVLRLSNMIGKPYVYHFCGEKFLQFLYTAFSKTPRSYLGLKANEIRSFAYVQDVVSIITNLIISHINSSNNNNNNTATTNGKKSMAINTDTIDSKKTTTNNVILNVGGPVGLSRVDVAQILAQSQHCSLDIHSEKKNDFQPENTLDSKLWSVYIQDNISNINTTGAVSIPTITTSAHSTSSQQQQQQQQQPEKHQEDKTTIKFIEFCSPRDITMDSNDTEVYMTHLINQTSPSSSSSSSLNTTTDSTSSNHSKRSRLVNDKFEFTPLEQCIHLCLHV